jgi:hypothetical protein
MGLSKRLVDDFIRPTLLVGLFKPPEEVQRMCIHIYTHIHMYACTFIRQLAYPSFQRRYNVCLYIYIHTHSCVYMQIYLSHPPNWHVPASRGGTTCVTHIHIWHCMNVSMVLLYTQTTNKHTHTQFIHHNTALSCGRHGASLLLRARPPELIRCTLDQETHHSWVYHQPAGRLSRGQVSPGAQGEKVGHVCVCVCVCVCVRACAWCIFVFCFSTWACVY